MLQILVQTGEPQSLVEWNKPDTGDRDDDKGDEENG